jgi:hypothetical protein
MAATKTNTRNVGAETERHAARYFRDEGWAGAERRIRTGYRTATRTVADQGDLMGLPGLCVQVKSLRDKRAGRDPNAPMELMVDTWLHETEEQREASRAALGLLVVRRWTAGSDVGRWWCFLDLPDLQGLLDGTLGWDHARSWGPEYAPVPVRLELQDVVALLKAQGWGATELDEVAG